MPAVQLAPTQPTPAIGYIRVSLAREEMISPELQRQQITTWATRTGHVIVKWVEDLDATGSNFKRKIMDVIERVERGEAKVVAVWKYSRFGRVRAGIEINLARIEAVGGQLQSATEEVDATTATGWFQRDMIFSVAAFESKRAGETWRETHEWRRNHGLPASGQRRFGYIWHPRRLPQLDGTFRVQQERYEPDPDLAPVVRDLYERYIEGDGFAKLTASLNERRIPNTRGNVWDLTALRRFMDTGFAAGYLRLHDPACKQPYRWDCPGHRLVRHPTHQHPAIISDALWEQYTERRARIKKTPPRARSGTYPLAGLIRCGLCGKGVHRTSQGGSKASMTFRCGQRRLKGKSVCVGVTRTERLVELAVLEWLAENAVAEGIDRQRPSILAPTRASLGERDSLAQRTSLQQQITKLERGVTRQMRSHALSEDDDADGSLEKEHQLTLRSLRAEKADLAAALAALDDVPDDVKAEEQRAASVPIIEGLLAEWDVLPPVRINAMLQRVVRRIEICEDRQVRVVPTWES